MSKIPICAPTKSSTIKTSQFNTFCNTFYHEAHVFNHCTNYRVNNFFFFFSISEVCKESEVGWKVKNRPHNGDKNAVQTWITSEKFTCKGVVSQWRYWTGRSVAFRAMVLRQHPFEDQKYDIVGINDIPAGATEQMVAYEVPEEKRILVREGDVIGFAWNQPTLKHAVRGVDANAGDASQMWLIQNANPYSLKTYSRLTVSRSTSRAYAIKAIITGNELNL